MADKALNKEEISVLVGRRIDDAGQIGNTKLSKERENVLKFYNGELPARQSQGSSSYVSTDVYDAVEAMKASLLETFSSGHEILKFTPQNEKDVKPAQIATEYTNYVLFRQNDGFNIFQDVIDDGLKSRAGIVKMYWQEDKEYQDETFEGAPEEAVMALAGQEDIEDLEADFDETTGTYSGKLTKVAVSGQVVIDVVPPEEFGIEKQAKCLKDSFHYHVTLKTLGELKADGFDVSALRDTTPDADEITDRDHEKDVRHNPIDPGYNPESDRTDANRRYKVYECYMKHAAKATDRPKLYKIVRVAGKILAMDEVDRTPFKVFIPLRVAHSFYGNNFAARVIPTQNSRTVLTRGILDHTAITNNPRYTVLQGGLTNPREMLDNRLGGLVNISRPDAVQPLAQASLNPFVYQTLEMLKMANEETIGISALSQGLNKDAISTQNSQGMVQDLVSLSQTRQKVIARNFASFLTEVYIEIYRLAMENDDKQSVMEVAGAWEEINPKTWSERKDVDVSLYLGAGEFEAQAAKLASFSAMGLQDPSIGRMIGDKGKYNIASQVLRYNRFKNVSDFLTPPEQLPPPQPDPMVLKKMELEERTVAVGEMQAQAAMLKAQADVSNKEMTTVINQMKFDLDMLVKMADVHRKDADVANKIDVAQRELEVAEAAPAIDPAKAIVSPNS